MKKGGESIGRFRGHIWPERRRIRTLFVVIPLAILTACGDRPAVGTPLIADIEAAAETKPPPNAAILSDPNADARYNAEIEAWGDRVSAAGRRLCRFYRDVGVKVECGTSQ